MRKQIGRTAARPRILFARVFTSFAIHGDYARRGFHSSRSRPGRLLAVLLAHFSALFHLFFFLSLLCLSHLRVGLGAYAPITHRSARFRPHVGGSGEAHERGPSSRSGMSLEITHLLGHDTVIVPGYSRGVTIW